MRYIRENGTGDGRGRKIITAEQAKVWEAERDKALNPEPNLI